jgi:phage baseplate assembly protein W
MSFDLKIVGGDIAISSSGDAELVFNNEKLRQDIVKILITKVGSNKYHPNYGSEMGDLQIGNVADVNFLELDLQSSAEEAIRKLILLQRKQSRVQFLSPAEVIVDIVEVSVARDINDPRAWNIFISVLTQKLTTLTESLQIRII